MAMRGLCELDSGTLSVLASVAVSRSDLASRSGDVDEATTPQESIRILVAQLRRDALVATNVERALNDALGACAPEGQTVAAQARRLRVASLARDPRGVAAVLWTAARMPGFVWRRLEARARRALLVLVLSELMRPWDETDQQLAAK